MAKSASVRTPKTVTPVGYQPPPEGFLNMSQLSEFLKCRYRWDTTNTRKIVSRKSQRALDLGSAVHAGMAAGMRKHAELGAWKPANLGAIQKSGRIAMKKWLDEVLKSRGGIELLDEEEHAEYMEIRQESVGILETALEKINPKRLKVVSLKGKPLVELSLVLPLSEAKDGWKGWHGTPDFVAEDVETGGIWLIDYKVRKQFTPPEAEEVNMQMASYQKLLRHHGIETVGTIMYQIKAKSPQQPKMNQNGTMSRAQISTDWETYKAALVSAGLNPADYEADMKPKLGDGGFRREDRVYRGTPEVEWIWHDVIMPAVRMMARERLSIFRTMNHMNCMACNLREFCLAELRNDDTSFHLETGFVDLKNPKERLILKPSDVTFTD